MHELVLKSQTKDKEEINAILEYKYNKMSKRSPTENRKQRILISGSIIDDPALIHFIEDLGVSVVADDLCVGTRYFWTLTELTQAPLHDLAARYLSKPILPAKVPSEKRFEYLRTLINRYKVEGAMLHQQKFCDPYNIDNPSLLEVLKEANIPVLAFETSYPLVGMGQLRTRIEAFIELLQT